MQAKYFHLLPVVEAVGVLGVVLGLTLHRSGPVTIGQVKVGVSSVDIHN